MTYYKWIAPVVLLTLCGMGLCAEGMAQGRGEHHTQVPYSIDPQKRYLFYMHGNWIEKRGLGSSHPKWGAPRYHQIVDVFSRRGFVVISELRLREVSLRQYSQKVADQVLRLLDEGVPASRITVMGHSKGGHMALMVGSIVEKRDLNIVVLAGCASSGTSFRRNYLDFLSYGARTLKGRVLSLYDADDDVAGSCEEVFDKAAWVETSETVLRSGWGHGLFFKPAPVWINAVADWIE